ncbi:MAG: family 78 glycoside hydrolase catalytic domain [Clostridia bacterium]|nr:family 78 glycoside hydrolase catalytic domain [Clostridia bacterium]
MQQAPTAKITAPAQTAPTLAAPDRLRINLLSTPLGLPTADPSFSWRMRVAESSTEEIQTGYRICIADRQASFEEDYLLDTGWIASDENSDVHIAGLDSVLKDNELYYWSVRTRNKNGLESRMSEWQPFTTAVGEEWESTDGIWCARETSSEELPKTNGDDFAFLRTEFECPMTDRIEKAILSVTAASPEPARQFVYHVFLNGCFVGLGPARFDRDEQGRELQYYHTYDVTDSIQAGSNALGALCYTQAEQSFLCQLTLYYKNGTKRIVLNTGRDAEDFMGMSGRGIFRGSNSIGTNYYVAAAQNIDASRFPYGYDMPRYDASAFSAVVRKSAQHPLAPFPGENVERHSCPAVSVTERDSGILLVDLGREIVGGLQLAINVPTECEITLRYGEELNEDGSVKYRMRTSNVYTERWLCSPDVPVMENYGMMTYRYIEIIDCPVPLTVQNVNGIALRREFDEELSSFTCVNDTLCELYDTFKYAICATNQDLYVDSQSRERAAYEGDLLINMLSAYTFELPGMLPRFSARYLLTHRTWPAEYELTTIRAILLDYLYTGNRALIKETYPRLRTILTRETPDPSTGLMPRRTANQHGMDAILVDWPMDSRDGYDTQNAHFNTVYNAFYYAVLSDMEYIAKELGKENDRRDWRAAKDALQSAMLTYLYNEEAGAFRDGLYEDGTPIEHYAQHATVFPLYAGVCEPHSIADACGRYIVGQGDIRTSVYGAYFLMEALYGAGFGNYATALLADDGTTAGVHSWAASLAAKDITIAPEAWYVEEKSNMTFSHPWGSAPASLITRCMFGIRPTAPGFRTFEIRPRIGDLSYASIRVPTVKGTIRVSLGQNSEAYEAEVTIPANTVADIYLPVLPGGTETLFLNDRIANYPIEDTVYHIRLGSGKYRLLAQ